MSAPLKPEQTNAAADRWDALVAAGADPDSATAQVSREFNLTPPPVARIASDATAGRMGEGGAGARGLTGREVLELAANGATLGLGNNVMAAGQALVGQGSYRDNLAASQGRLDAARQANPMGALISEGVGGIATAPLGGMASGALRNVPLLGGIVNGGGMIRGGITGGVMGGTYAAADADDQDMAGRMREGMLGGVAGAVVGGAVVPGVMAGGRFARRVGGAVADRLNPAAAARRNIQTLLPDNFPEIAARQEALAPGTLQIPAADKTMSGIMRQLSDDPATAQRSLRELQQSQRGLGAARKRVGAQYDEIGAKIVPIDELAGAPPKTREVLAKLGFATEADFAPAKALIDAKQELTYRTRNMKIKAQKGEATTLGEREVADLQRELDPVVDALIPEVRPVDADYGFLSDRMKATASGAKFLRTAQVGGVNRATRGMSDKPGLDRRKLSDVLNLITTPGQEARGAAAYQAIMQNPQPETELAAFIRQRLLEPGERIVAPVARVTAPFRTQGAVRAALRPATEAGRR